MDEVVELVTTGPEAGTVTNRDTQVVVQELFRNAEHSVLVAGYELYRSGRPRPVALQARTDET